MNSLFKKLITPKYDHILRNEEFYDEFMILAAKIVKSPDHAKEYKAAKRYIKEFWPGFLSRETLTFIQTDDECPICLEHIKKKDLFIKPCGHKFHKHCYMEALYFGYDKCPVCDR